MPKYKVRIGRFPYGGVEASECVDWLMQTAVKISADPRFELDGRKVNDTPITMTRNAMFIDAIRDGIDYLLIVDSDMAPDVELGVDPAAKPFWDTAIDFLLNHPTPAIVAAPYCGPPPHENVYVFTWDTSQGDHPDADGQIVQYPRHQAATLIGIQEAVALATGLMLIDMRVFKSLRHPFTYYEFDGDGKVCDVCGEHKRGPEAKKASTEDVTFSRDLSLAGVKMYCAWDCWAGHIKRKIVRKPRPFTCDQAAGKLKEVILANIRGDVQQVAVNSDLFAAEIAKAEAEYARLKAEMADPAGWKPAAVTAPPPRGKDEALPFAEEIAESPTRTVTGRTNVPNPGYPYPPGTVLAATTTPLQRVIVTPPMTVDQLFNLE